MIDKDGNGKIEINELKELLKCMFYNYIREL